MFSTTSAPPSTLYSTRYVEVATRYSGTRLRKLVRAGVVQPLRDERGRLIWTEPHIAAVLKYRATVYRGTRP